MPHVQESPLRFLIRVIPSNAVGTNARSATPVLVEYADAPTVTPSSFSLVSLTGPALRVSWAPPAASVVSLLRGYLMRLSTDGLSYDDTPLIASTTSNGIVTSNTTSATLGNLVVGANSRAWLQLLLQGNAGVSLRHSAIGPILLSSSVPAPYNARVTAVTDTSVTLVWDAPSQPLLRWQVLYVAQVNSSIASNRGNVSVAATTTATVTGLTTGMPYVFSVRAVTIAGEGDAISVAGTPQSAPPSPSSLSIVLENAAGTVVLGWEGGAWALHAGANFRVTWATVNSDGHASAPRLVSDAITQSSVQVTGLTAVCTSMCLCSMCVCVMPGRTHTVIHACTGVFFLAHGTPLYAYLCTYMYA
jgi:hypothetical protein